MDATPQFWDAVLRQAQSQGLGEEKLRKLKASHILRVLSRHSAFVAAAADVAKMIQAVGDLCRRHRRDFTQLGACSEAERDRIEAEIGTYIKACTDNIARLEKGIPVQAELAFGRSGVNATTAAHYHGVCLLLSERLQHIGKAFDHYRAVRYQQVMRQRNKRSASQALGGRDDHRGQGDGRGGGFVGQQQVQQTVDAENAALQQQLLSMSSDVTRMERSMREIATLNQMFSTQVVHQSEQIEHIYSQAVQASANITRGNVHLRKAIRYSAAARRYVLVLLLAASAGLLFFDYWYSGRKPR